MGRYKRRKKKKRSENQNIEWWIVIVLILLTVLFILSLGTLDFVSTSQESKTSTPEERKKWLLHRHEKITLLIQRKEGLLAKINSLSTKIYFCSKIFIVTSYITFSSIGYFYLDLSLSTLLNITETLAILYFCGCFIAFDKPKDAIVLLQELKLIIENNIFRKYAALNEEISKLKIELESIMLEKSILELVPDIKLNHTKASESDSHLSGKDSDANIQLNL